MPKNTILYHSRVFAYQRIMFFANISKSKGFRALSCIKCLYKHAHCGHFESNMGSVGPSEAKILKIAMRETVPKKGRGPERRLGICNLVDQIFLKARTLMTMFGWSDRLPHLESTGFWPGTGLKKM